MTDPQQLDAAQSVREYIPTIRHATPMRGPSLAFAIGTVIALFLLAALLFGGMPGAA